MLEWAHKTDGHPGVERTLWFFQKYFFAKSSDASLKKILSKIIAECPCTKAKANTAADRGEVRNLPIPNEMNSILFVDFMELPKFAGHDFALLVTDGLSRYSRVFPLTKKVDGEEVLKEIFEGWVQVYGLPKITGTANHNTHRTDTTHTAHTHTSAQSTWPASPGSPPRGRAAGGG